MTERRGQMGPIYPVSGEPFRYLLDDQGESIHFQLEGESAEAESPGIILSVTSRGAGEGQCRTPSGRLLLFSWAWVGTELHLWLDGHMHIFETAVGGQRGSSPSLEESGDVLAPMPGGILEVLVREGQRVERGQTVLIMESMKMELAITVPRDGVVRRITVKPGQQVDRGMRLLDLDSTDQGGER